MAPERKAVLGLLALAAVGHGLRLIVLRPDQAPGAIQIAGAQASDALLARRDSLAALARPLGSGERINLDRARAEEIARLPGVGMSLAKRIVDDRTARGAFGSLSGLDRVAGIGPGLLRKLEGQAEFQAGGADRAGGTDGVRESAPDGPIVSVPSASPDSSVPPGLLDILNHGDHGALDRLPGIGPARARRIVSFRDSAGFFTSFGDLERVPGLSRATVRRLVDGFAGSP